MKWLWLAAFAAMVPVANWLIGHVGNCIPNGPCIIPVGFGLYAPSGVLAIGAALVLRDQVHRHLGWQAALAAIGIGAVLSFAIATPALAVASLVAFSLSEVADLGVYAPLARRKLWAAVVASGIVGAAVDSALFLWLAFGSLNLIEGQIAGKFYASILFGAWLAYRAIPHPKGA